ncbi:MAG: hypothetical protein U9Q22_00020 [Candidatus Altiarchaeota archaeon]|nr:hypothetical protein [Candidatus Altiarchaeota archaeon]
MRRKIYGILLLILVLTPMASAFVDALTEEAIEASRRYAVAKNYERLIEDRIDVFRDVDGLILENPSLQFSAARGVMNLFIRILEPLYVTAIILLGIYLLFFSGSPRKRAKAKSSLMLSILSMAIVSVSPYVLLLFFSLSHSVTQNILAHAPVEAEKPFIHAAEYLLDLAWDIIGGRDLSARPLGGVERPGLTFLLLSYFLLEASLLILNLRYFMLAVLAAVFPLTLLLYSFLPTRTIGRLLMEQTVLWTLAQAAMALILITVAIGINITDSIATVSIPEAFIFIMEITGLIMLMLTPLVVVGLFRGFLR